MDSRVKRLPTDECFPKQLTDKIQKWNDRATELENRITAAPQERKALKRKVAAGEIDGAEAVEELRKISAAVMAATIDLRAHLNTKDPFDLPIQEAYKKEADKMAIAAKKRSNEIRQKVQDVLKPAAITDAIRQDGAFSKLDQEARRLRQASVGLKGEGHRDDGWLVEFERSVLASF